MRSMRAHVVALAAVALAGCAAPLENRDKHGPADVSSYIARLVEEERVRELDPQSVIAALDLPSDAIVADVGCGPGVFSIPFALACPDGVVYAVDVEPLQLDALRSRVERDAIANIVPVLASYADPHLPPAGVDLIFIADTYHHIDDRTAYLRQLRADLAPGGRLALLEYKPGELPVGPPPSRKVPRTTRHAELTHAGWTLVRTFDTHRWHDFELWRATEE